jgi:PKD repeat protein
LCNPTGGFDSIPFFDSLLTTTHPYHWNFGDPASGAANESTEQFPVHYFTGPGVYTVTLSLESDCTPLQITQQVTVTQQTPLQPQISNTLGTLECTPAFSYQWYMNGMLISGATLQQFTPSQVGNYWVVISDASGCNAQSEPYGYWILGQVAQAQNNFLRIYPNPASEFVFMDASDHGNWMLYDISGKLCLTGHANKGPNRIILKDLQKGMYVLRAGEKVARLVVE